MITIIITLKLLDNQSNITSKNRNTNTVTSSYLFSFLNESPLEGVYLLDHFICGWVASLKLPPSMNIHRILQLFLESLATSTLLKQLTLDVVQLTPGEGGISVHLTVYSWFYNLHTDTQYYYFYVVD